MLTRCRTLLTCLLLVLATTLGACTPAASRTTAPAAATLLQVTLAQGGVAPNAEVRKVPVGSAVTLRITSDRDDIIHVHGFDLEIPVKAGETVEKTFTADAVGRVEIESHSPTRTLYYLDIA